MTNRTNTKNWNCGHLLVSCWPSHPLPALLSTQITLLDLVRENCGCKVITGQIKNVNDKVHDVENNNKEKTSQMRVCPNNYTYLEFPHNTTTDLLLLCI